MLDSSFSSNGSASSNKNIKTIIKRKETLDKQNAGLNLQNLSNKPDLAMLDLQKAVKFQMGQKLKLKL